MIKGMNISFEFYPPKTNEGMLSLIDNAAQLMNYNPQYCSVTFGAGGSVQDNTAITINKLQQSFAVNLVPHLSCINSTKERIDNLLSNYLQRGINELVVLRGDLPENCNDKRTFRFAADLIQYIRQSTGNNFTIHAAIYPETHPETNDPIKDLSYFKQKVIAGANHAITQYCYNIEAFETMLEDCAKLGINIPITAGIMPITNYNQLARFSAMCGAEIPRWLQLRLERYANDSASLQALGSEIVVKLCEKLLKLDFHGLHFYSLNKAPATLAIIEGLGIQQTTNTKQTSIIS